jgi:hypothetical protein
MSMHPRTLITTISTCILLTIANASATPQADTSSATAAQKLAAMQFVDSTIKPLTLQAHCRITQMTEFISTKGMNAKWDTYRSTAADKPKGISFDKAYGIALQRVVSEHPTPDADVADPAAALAKEKAMVSKDWAAYENMQAKMLRVSSFIQTNGMMDDYMTWAKDKGVANTKAANARTAATDAKSSERLKANKAKYKARQRYLATHWDEAMHVMSLSNDSGYIMERNKGSVVADSHQYPYLDSQTEGVNLNTEDQSNGSLDYWGGSNYGGYSDPYYDVWGHHGGEALTGHDANGIHPAYARTADHRYPHAGSMGGLSTGDVPSVKWSGKPGPTFSTAGSHPAK